MASVSSSQIQFQITILTLGDYFVKRFHTRFASPYLFSTFDLKLETTFPIGKALKSFQSAYALYYTLRHTHLHPTATHRVRYSLFTVDLIVPLVRVTFKCDDVSGIRQFCVAAKVEWSGGCVCVRFSHVLFSFNLSTEGTYCGCRRCVFELKWKSWAW